MLRPPRLAQARTAHPDHHDTNGHSATMQVPVEIHGSPPVIAFNARYLADALEHTPSRIFRRRYKLR